MSTASRLGARRFTKSLTTRTAFMFFFQAEDGIRDLTVTGVQTCALPISLVLFLFLRDLRSVAVTFVSIPLALLAAVIVVDAVGWTINTMTLGGLAVALGEIGRASCRGRG